MLYIIAQPIRNIDFLMLNSHNQVLLVLLKEWHLANDHLKHNNAQRPHIDQLVIATGKHFGGFIGQCSSTGPHLAAALAFTAGLSDLEVD
jgi:hypothetical protein